MQIDPTSIFKHLNKNASQIFIKIIGQLENQTAAKIDNSAGAFMPLYVEYLGVDTANGHIPNGKRYSLAHYYTCNYDRMRDPDVEFIYDGKNVFPVYYMQDGLPKGDLRQDVFSYDGKGKISGYKRFLANDIKDFCNLWMKNLKFQQGI